jgi:hypothetical protein
LRKPDVVFAAVMAIPVPSPTACAEVFGLMLTAGNLQVLAPSSPQPTNPTTTQQLPY